MSGQIPSQVDLKRDMAPLWIQLAAWLVAVAACVFGMLDRVAEWSPAMATMQLVVLSAAPVLYMVRFKPRGLVAPSGRTWNDWLLSVFVAWLSFNVWSLMNAQLGDLPPAYHDEFSYLFQAKTLLAGRFSFPSHPLHPELFDQMHVLNEGRMASRYYPGTGLWLAPFVAMGQPYLASCLAGVLATVLVYWIGREIGGRLTGFVASAAMALSPAIGLFGNTLLSHHPTLVGLSFFLLGVARWRRTRATPDAWIAGMGLSFAMLCRPMTAAAVGLPFGLDVAAWLIRRRTAQDATPPTRIATVAGFGVPLVLGWSIMLSYNHDITGDWLTSPYQLYTDVYTPRHVYGFNNVVRAEQHLGPKVLDEYDRWAQNLTWELALQNAQTRWITSWLWTLDVIPLLMTTVLFLGISPRLDRRWLLVGAAIISLHLLHIPYWFTGIMGWHYVFESAPLWCLLLGAVTSLLVSQWNRRGQSLLSWWWFLFLGTSLYGAYFVGVPQAGMPSKLWTSRVVRSLKSMQYPRQRHQALRLWIAQHVDQPSLVLIDQESHEIHLELVDNEPGLRGKCLLGRIRDGSDLSQIRRDFPDRHVYVASPDLLKLGKVE